MKPETLHDDPVFFKGHQGGGEMENTNTQGRPVKDGALLWKPAHLDGVSLFKACFSNFSYKKHCHREFAIGVIEQGVQQFYHRGSNYTAPPGTIISLNPDEVHDGMSASKTGYRYRMVYISRNVIRKMSACRSASGSFPGYFSCPVIFDKKMAARLLHALRLLDGDRQTSLESHTCLARVVSGLFCRYGSRRFLSGPRFKDREIVNRALAYIRDNVAQNITLNEIAASVDLSQYHFLRIFKNTTGLPPHAYLVQRRVEMAKAAIEGGCSIALAALESGFSDQSHMTRCFKSVYGVPPGRYKAALFS